MYKVETENFFLELKPEVHQDNLPFPVYTSLDIKVSSYGFSAESVMDIDVRGLCGKLEAVKENC